MISKTIAEIAAMIDGQLILNKASLNDRVEGVSIDSRKIKKEGLYIPIVGERANGHAFIKDIEDKGAALTLCSDASYIPTNMAVIIVEDCLHSLQQLAALYRKELRACVIGVTGSNGKTSCKDILAGCLSGRYKTQKTAGNYNNEIGVPLTLLSLDEDCEMAIIEMGMENRDEITFLNTMVQQDMSILTNVGIAHMENLGSMENIGHAKLEIADCLDDSSFFVYYGDDETLSKIIPEKQFPKGLCVETFGERDSNNLYIKSLIQSETGISFTTNRSDFSFQLSILGKHQAINALAALLIGYRLGLCEEEMQRGFDTMEKTSMRNELMQVGTCKILNDAYKSNPQSAIAALDTFSLFDIPYKVVVLADMLDLGPTTNHLHYDLGYRLQPYHFDEILCVGSLAKHIAEGAHKAQCEGIIKIFDTNEQVALYLNDYIHKECMILFKGSRGMALEVVINTMIEQESIHEKN